MLMPVILASFLFVYAAEGCGNKALGSIEAALNDPCKVQDNEKLAVFYDRQLSCDIRRPRSASGLDDAPGVKLDNADENRNYTVFMLNGGLQAAPIDIKNFPYIHWMVTNINGRDLKTGKFPNANIDYAYQRPNPNVIKKFLFVAFKQPETVADVEVPGGRQRFNLWNFLVQNNMCRELSGVFQFQITKN